MPYPNSQTPVTLRLNALFCDPGSLAQTMLPMLQNTRISLATIATDARFNIAPGQHGYAHVDAWPIDQQNKLRAHLILALTKGMQVCFDWQADTTTSTDIVLFPPSNQMGVTFRSPVTYPPYSMAP